MRSYTLRLRACAERPCGVAGFRAYGLGRRGWSLFEYDNGEPTSETHMERGMETGFTQGLVLRLYCRGLL